MKNRKIKLFFILPIILLGGYFICAGREARAAGETLHSVSAGGNWSDPNTWEEKRVPKAGDAVVINGIVDYSEIMAVSALTVNPGAVFQSAPNYNYYNLTVNGNVVNNGTIRDGYNYFLINISGSIYNNGVWNNFRTGLLSSEPRIIGGLNPLTGFDIAFYNSFEILNSPVFAGGVSFNNQTIDLPSPEQNITLLGRMSSPVTIRGQGSLVAGPGADISSNIIAGKVIFDSGNQAIGQVNITADQIILRGSGLKEVWGYPAIFNGDLIIEEGAVLQNISNYSYALIVNGDVINSGIIQNNPNNYYYFYINISGNILNNGQWNNYQTSLIGGEPRIIDGVNSFASAKIFLDSSFEIKSSPVFMGSINFNNKTLTVNEPYVFTANGAFGGGNINGNGKIIFNGMISDHLFNINNPEVYFRGDINGTIYAKQMILDGANNQAIGQVKITADKVILRGGAKEVWGYPAIINSELNVEEGAVLQNISNYGYILNVNGDVINNGTIRNNINDFYINISGNIFNNGLWINSRTALFWSSVLGFEKYLFNISLNQNNWPPPIELPSNNYDVSGILNDANYWRVSAKVGGYYTPWSEVRTINGPDKQSALSYSDEGGYKQDLISPGANPNKGVASSTDFIFKLIYTNSNNIAPDRAEIAIIGGENTYAYSMIPDTNIDTLPDLRDGDFRNGEQYVFSGVFPQGKYKYYFKFLSASEVVFLPEEGMLGFEAGYSNIIFLPGIKASRLYTPGTFFENQLWEPNREKDVEKLFLDENGDSINHDVYTRDVISEVNIVGTNIYKTFLESLDNMVAEKIINESRTLPYDWRLDLLDTAGGAVKTDTGEYLMIEEIEKLASSSQTGKVTIIAHSTGGLAAKSLINNLSNKSKANLIDKLVLVAVPQAGTPEAIAGMLHGDKQDLGLGIILSNKTSRLFTENMKSAYSLLPSSRYFEIAEEPVIKFDESSLFLKKIRNFYGNEINSMEMLADFLAGAEGRVKPGKGDTNTPYVLPSSFIEGAGAFHETVDSWSAPAGIEVIQIAGWGLDTISGIKYSEKYVSAACDPKTNYCSQVLTYDREPIFSKDGDEVVMLSSATEMGDAKTYYLNFKEYNKFFEFNINRKHANILEVDSVQRLLKNITTSVSAPLPSYIYNNKQYLGTNDKRLRVSVHSPVSLDIYDSSDLHTGLIENPDPESDIGYIEEEIPNSYYFAFAEDKYVGVSSGDEYRLELGGLDYGDFTLKITEVRDDGETTILYQDIPVTPATKASLEMENMENKSPLKIDMDGDGLIDLELSSPEEARDSLIYIGMIELSIENMSLDKHIKKYLLIKFEIIEKQVEKGNAQAVQAIIASLEDYLKEKTEKFIPHKDAQIIFNLISNLNNLMIK